MMTSGQMAFTVLKAIDKVWLPPGMRVRLCNTAFYEEGVRRIRPDLPPVSLREALGLKHVRIDYGIAPQPRLPRSGRSRVLPSASTTAAE